MKTIILSIKPKCAAAAQAKWIRDNFVLTDLNIK